MANKSIQYLVIGFLLFTVLQSSYLLYKVDEVTPYLHAKYRGTAAASGAIGMCINTPPNLTVPCNATAEQSSKYTCQLNASDPDSNTTFTFNSTFLTTPSLFNTTADGFINFTPNNNETGNHTVEFSVKDGTGCSNNMDTETFDLEVENVNDPPFLDTPIPNVSFSANETVRAFFLDNHFSDPDGDNLTYSVSGTDEANVDILNTSEVVIDSDTCDFEDLVLFTAKDPFNLTAESNEVIISCTTEDSGSGQTDTTTTQTQGGGGGGGGGGLCKPNFQCSDYTECQPDNTKRKRCVDVNGCKETEFITVECNYEEEQEQLCEEDWECGSWGECTINGTQTRECEDLNSCGTEEDKPATERECEYTPTCDDGVKNGNETGIDCGGDCPPCQQIESPSPIEEESVWSTTLVWLVMLMLLGSLAYKYEHQRILRGLSRLGLQFAGRVRKEVLLGDEERDELLHDLDRLQDEISSKNLQELTDEFTNITKSYFFHALGLKIDTGKEDLLAELEEGKVNEHLKKVLISFFDKTLDLEFSAQPPDGYELMALMEELREIVLETSEYDHDILRARVTEYGIPDNLYDYEKAYLKMVNSYIALHFNELQQALEKYMDLLDFYEDLSERQKDVVYEDISRLYQKIRYRSSWIQNM